MPEASAFLGAFSLVACDMTADCVTLNRDPQPARPSIGYCDALTLHRKVTRLNPQH